MTIISGLTKGSTGHVIFFPWYSGIEKGEHIEPAPNYLDRRGYQPVVRRNVQEEVAERAEFVQNLYGDYNRFSLDYWNLIGDLKGIQAVNFRKLTTKRQEPVQVDIRGFIRKKPVYEYRSVEYPIGISSILEKSTSKNEQAGVFQYDVRDMSGYDGRYVSSFTYSMFMGNEDFNRVEKEVAKTPQIIPNIGKELFPFWFEYLRKKVKLKKPIQLIRSLDDVKLNLRRF